MSLLRVKGLRVSLEGKALVKSIDFSLEPGQVMGIVGESGSGKSLTALALAGLLPSRAQVAGSVLLAGEELLEQSETQWRQRRGREIGLVFQEPMTALNPLMTIGDQVAETALIHQSIGRSEALALARQALDRVGLCAPRYGLDRYPHELSGGQRQRVAIAMATLLKPKILIADEPTTALDARVQADILDLLRELAEHSGCGIIHISHDLGVMAQSTDHLAVMFQGELIEQGPSGQILRHPAQGYTQRLVENARHRLRLEPALADDTTAVLEVASVVREYPRSDRFFSSGKPSPRALDGVSLRVGAGEFVGIVGESGSGKSTLLRAILALDPLQGGQVKLLGQPFDFSLGKKLRDLRKQIQVVFQDPKGSFDPRWPVDRIVGEALEIAQPHLTLAERAGKISAALAQVGLPHDAATRYPHEFSGGQRQRIALARALVAEPRLIVLDEAVSALDVSIRATILDLLADLNSRLGISFLFVSHDIGVIRAVCHRVYVMSQGKIVEEGDTVRVFEAPQHRYTRELLAAVPAWA